MKACISCPKDRKRPAIGGGVYCGPHRREHAASMRRQRAERRAAGLCIECGEPVDQEGAVKCPACRAEHTALMKRRRDEKRARGECSDCPEPAEEGKRKCQTHLNLATARKALRTSAA